MKLGMHKGDLEHANFIDIGNAYHELRDMQLMLELISTADKMKSDQRLSSNSAISIQSSNTIGTPAHSLCLLHHPDVLSVPLAFSASQTFKSISFQCKYNL